MTKKIQYRTAMDIFALMVCILLVCSCLSFDIADAPSKFVYPHNSPSANWCGQAGAFSAYYLMYYAGPGVFVLLGSVICLLVWHLTGAKVTQLWLRTIGMILLAMVVSVSIYMRAEENPNGFPMPGGGILGPPSPK